MDILETVLLILLVLVAAGVLCSELRAGGIANKARELILEAPAGTPKLVGFLGPRTVDRWSHRRQDWIRRSEFSRRIATPFLGQFPPIAQRRPYLVRNNAFYPHPGADLAQHMHIYGQHQPHFAPNRTGCFPGASALRRRLDFLEEGHETAHGAMGNRPMPPWGMRRKS